MAARRIGRHAAMIVSRPPLPPARPAAPGALAAAAPESGRAWVLEVRGPRVLASMAAGAGLASAGAAYQNLFRNPLVSPDILGVAGGCALGAVTGIFLALPIAAI